MLAACAAPANTLVLSVVSAWEIQIKRQLGRLELRVPLAEMIEVQMAENALEVLAVELAHVHALGELPLVHSDPFDRLLIAQAIAEEARLVTVDEAIHRYREHVEVLW